MSRAINDPNTSVRRPTRADHALYIEETLRELGQLAERNKFLFLKYLIGMSERQAHVESELILRSDNAQVVEQSSQ